MLSTGWHNGNPYPVVAKLQGADYVLPRGFKANIFNALTQNIVVTDDFNRICDFRIINGQPCLISVGGVWNIFTGEDAVQCIGGRGMTPQ